VTAAIDEATLRSLVELEVKTGFYEDVITALYSRILRPGDTAVDGGANLGLHTYPMADLVGPSGRVHAYEVIPTLTATMRNRIRTASLTQIHLHEQAISDRVEDVSFNWVKNAWGFSGLRSRDYGTINPDIEVLRTTTTTVDSLPEGDLTRWRFCKLDLEGGEFHALRGSRQAMRRHRPVVVFEHFIDQGARHYDYSQAEWFAFFRELDYELFDLYGREYGAQNWGDASVPWYLIAAPAQSADAELVRALAGEIVLDCAHLARANLQRNRPVPTPPNSHKLAVAAAAALGREGKPEDALTLYAWAAALAPDHPEMHHQHANCLERLGRFPEALEAARNATSLRSERAVDWRLQARLAERVGALSESEAAFRRATQCADAYAQDWVNLARLLVRTNQFEPALEAMTVAMRTGQPDAGFYCWLAIINSHLGRRHEAEQAFEEAVRLEPETQWIRQSLAEHRSRANA
jgi:FkbM family methyltransferase